MDLRRDLLDRAELALCTTFRYTERLVCEGRDRMKIAWIAAVAGGALIGAPLGSLSGRSIIRRACEHPGAGNLGGIADSIAFPIYVVIGALIGAFAAAVAIVVIVRAEA